MTHGIALVGVLNQLRLGCSPRGEVEKQRIVGPGFRVRGEIGRGPVSPIVIGPTRCRTANAGAGEFARELGELLGIVRSRNHVAHIAALDAVQEIVMGQ